MRKEVQPVDLRSSQCPCAVNSAAACNILSLPFFAAQGPQCIELTSQARKNTRRRAISPLEVRPMGQKRRHKSEDAIRREWLRKLKELWEKRKRRKRQPK